jgi:fatty acid synthase subunit alpha
VRWTETQDLLLSEFQTRKTVEIGPAETLTNMMKRTRDLVYRPYDTANNVSREFLSIKKNRDDVYYVGQERVVKAAPKKEAAPAPAKATDAPAATASAAAAPAAASPAPIVAAQLDDAPVTAADIIRTIVSIALKKPAKDVAFDQSVKGLSGGRFRPRATSRDPKLLTVEQDDPPFRMRSRATLMLSSAQHRTAPRRCR